LSEFLIQHFLDMKRVFNCLILLASFIVMLNACLPSKTIGTSGNDDYEEDLSQLRRAYADSLAQSTETERPDPMTNNPETPTLTANIGTRYSINEQMDDFFYEVTNRNEDENSYQGYTVQVYTGSSRDKANSAKNRVYSILPDTSPKVSFDPPNYKVKVGEFTDRLEAQSVYSELKRAFSVVLIVPERFPIVSEN